MVAFVSVWLFLQHQREDSAWIGDILEGVTEEADTPTLLGPDGVEIGPAYAAPSVTSM